MKFPPSAEEIRAYFDKHDLTRRQAAEMLDVAPRTVSYWKSGHAPMPYTAWFTLRAKVEGHPPA